MATPRSTRNRPSLATPKFNVADVAKQATRRKPAPGYSFSEPRQMAPGYGNPVTPTQRPNTDIVPKEPLPQLVRGKDGKMVPFDPNAEVPVRSYEDIGASLAQDEYTQNLATELDITGEQKGYTSLEEYAADQYDALKESKQLQEAKLADQQLQTSEGVTQAEKSLRSQTLSGASRLAGNREGFVSSSNQSVASKLGRLASEKMQRINSQKDLVDMEIEDARANLDRAERAGSTQIAEQYRQVLDAAEYKARQIDTEYYNALSQQAQEKRANFTAFQGLVDSGQELDTETIAGFAEQLGIPFNDAYGYYKGQQAVRDNNKLTNEEKAIELQNLAYDFDRKLRGIETEEAIKVDNFIKLVQDKNLSPEEIQMYAASMNIPNEANPFYLADLRIKQAEAKIAEINAGGEPAYGTTQYWEREALKYQVLGEKAAYNELYGNPPTAVDISQAQSIFNDLGKSRYRSVGLECGEGFNRITEGGKAGDSYASKMDLVTKRDMPMVGNGLVIPLTARGQGLTTGHIETVLAVGPDSFQTISWNRDGNGTMTIETYKTEDLNRLYGENWGFTNSTLKPEYEAKLAEVAGSDDGRPYIKLSAEDAQKYDKELTASDAFKGINKAKTSLDALNVFAQAFEDQGGDLEFVGADAGDLQAKYQAALLNLKEFFNLGVLNGPDLAILEKILPNPSNPNLYLRGGGSAVTSGIENMRSQLETAVKGHVDTIEQSYGEYGSQLGSYTTAQSIIDALEQQGIKVKEQEVVDNDLALYEYGVEDPLASIWDNL